MKQNSSNAISLKDWMVISIKGGLVLKYENGEHVRLVEISHGNNLRALSLVSEPDPNFSENDAWLVARVATALLRDGGAEVWDGTSLLLPISFNGFEIVSLRELATLAYCCHTTKKTRSVDDLDNCLYHVLFDGDHWVIAITDEHTLKFIQRD